MKKSRVAYLVLMIMLSFIFVSCNNGAKPENQVQENNSKKDGSSNEKGVSIQDDNTDGVIPDYSSAKVGDIITFGSYEQDGNDSNGKEPIEWEVIGKNGQNTLVISRFVLDMKPYHESEGPVTWETCSLRKWLNSSFVDSAFSLEEKGRIKVSTVKNPDHATSRSDSSKGGLVEGGNDTEDRVFILSMEDIRDYYSVNNWNTPDYGGDYYFGSSEKLISEPTPYVIALFEKLDNDDTDCTDVSEITEEWVDSTHNNKFVPKQVIGKIIAVWGTRTQKSGKSIYLVDRVGWFGNQTCLLDSYTGIRPAMWISAK